MTDEQSGQSNRIKDVFAGGLAASILLFTQRRRIRNIRNGIFCGGVGCICTVCCMVASIFVFVGYRVEVSAVTDAYGERLATICNPPAGGESSLQNLPEGGTPFGLLVLKMDDRVRHRFHDELPLDWKAEDQAAVDVVVCVEDGEQEIDRCEYEVEENSSRRIVEAARMQKTAHVVMLNAHSGLRIAEVTLEGAEPPVCPARYESLPAPRDRIEGDEVPVNDLITQIIFFYF